VSVIGTPAEEDGGGKALLLDAGIFDGVQAALMAHPAPVDADPVPFLAYGEIDVRYRGRAAHASAFPERGVNAADALTVAQVGVGLLRQHLHPAARVSGIVTCGGAAPNVVPAYASATYEMRARTMAELAEVRSRVERCFEAGARATGATLEIAEHGPAYADVRHDPDLSACYRRNAARLGRCFAPAWRVADRFAGSTDLGNVSHALPAIHPLIGIGSLPAVNHQPEFAAHCVSPAAERALMDGAVALAWTAIDAATEPGLAARLRALSTSRSG
jgi:amidohydrolase